MIPPLRTEELEIAVQEAEASVLLTLTGTADGRVDRELEVFLGRLHAAILRRPVGRVDVNIRELEFMNSSCFKGFITWIVQVRRMDPSSAYTIRFLSTKRHPWQRRSLHAISFFGGERIEIEEGA